MVSTATATTFFECDACCYEVGGYSRKDLLTEGWQWHDIGGGLFFVMCGECVEEYAKRRAMKAAA